MTTIASNVALTLLAQPSPLLAAPLLASSSAGGARSAADTILAIVSAAASAGEKPADAAPAPTARAVGGTVSSELSKPQLSAMAAAGSMVTSETTIDPAVYRFDPIKASVENAEAFIRKVSWGIDQFNDGLRPDDEIPDRQSFNQVYIRWGEIRIAKGDDPEKVKKAVADFSSDKAYQDKVDAIKFWNSKRKELAADAMEGIDNMKRLVSEVFGGTLDVVKNADGRLSLANITIQGKDGAIILKYDSKDGLKTFHGDGSVRTQYALNEVSQC